MSGKLIGDIDMDDIDPVEYAWMHHSWAEDYQDQWKLLENSSYLTASFMNPEGVKKALGESGQRHSTTDEEFDKTSEMIREYSQKIEEEKAKTSISRRRRRKRVDE